MIQISRSSRDRAVSGVVAPPRWVGGLRAPLSLPTSLSRGGVGLDTSLRDQTSSRRSSRVSWRIGRVTAAECGSFLWTTPRTRGVCGGCLGEPAQHARAAAPTGRRAVISPQADAWLPAQPRMLQTAVRLAGLTRVTPRNSTASGSSRPSATVSAGGWLHDRVACVLGRLTEASAAHPARARCGPEK